jgi:hypothetical protein
MPTRPPVSRTNPLEGIERLLIDGTNLLHALRRGEGAAPAATLIGRLRGVVEMPVRIELLFDGPPDPGLHGARIASGVLVRYSGQLSADTLLARMVSEAVDPGTLLVVTDDIDLRRELTRRGARTAGTPWIVGRLDRSRLVSPSIGRPKAPPAGEPVVTDDTVPAPGWQPGRGATAKHGNPKRLAKAQRPGPRR